MKKLGKIDKNASLIRWIKSIILLLFYLFFPSIIALFFYKYYTSSNNTIADLTRLIISTITFVITCYIFRKELKKSFKPFKKDIKNNVKIALKNWVNGFILMIIFNMCIILLVRNIATNETANRELLTIYPISSLISIILTGPICEELIFRANFRKYFKNKFSFCLTSGIIFGSAHLIASLINKNYLELLYIFSYSAVGYNMAKTYYETDNIYSSITYHIFHNTFTVSLILLATYMESLA